MPACASASRSEAEVIAGSIIRGDALLKKCMRRSKSGTIVRAPAARNARITPGLPSSGGLGSGGSPKNFSEHLLPFFQYWKNALEFSELAQNHRLQIHAVG